MKYQFDIKGKLIPLMDTVTGKLSKENWKDIPEFEGLYQLSSYGRVQSLSRWVYSKTGPPIYRHGRIIKLRFTPGSKKKKRNGKDVDIQMKLHKEAVRYAFSVARYVYYLFVAAFDLGDHTVIVRRKDKDKLNCYYRNLRLVSVSDTAKEGFASKKRKSIFQLQIKQVSEYSLDGTYLKTFKGAREAAKAVGVPPSYINDAARTKVRPTGNAYWRYGKPSQRIYVSKLKKRLEHSLRVKRKSVQQFTLQGKPVKIYNSVSKAAKAVGLSSATNISYACMGKLRTCKGFKWEYTDPNHSLETIYSSSKPGISSHRPLGRFRKLKF